MTDKIKCSHILVKKQSEANEILERLKKGESFVSLAKELSIDKGSAKRGGDEAFKLKKGELSPQPVKTEFGYHIIKRAG